MDMDFPSNSHVSKVQTEAPAEETPETKQTRKAVEGKVIRRKKTLGSRFREIFVGSESRSALNYVVFDILAPAAKDMVYDALMQGVERRIYGEGRRPSNRRHGGPPRETFVNYSAASRSSSTRPPTPSSSRRDEERNISRRGRRAHDFEEIILESRHEANEVIDRMYNYLEDAGVVTVENLYEILDVTATYTDSEWGWDDLKGVVPRPVRSGGYLIDLPNPIRL